MKEIVCQAGNPGRQGGRTGNGSLAFALRAGMIMRPPAPPPWRRPMLRAARPRLRLEPCEDRALPAGLAPTAPPFAPHAVQSPTDGPTVESGSEADGSDEASE